MRVALLTEGVSEYASLPALIPELQRRTGNIILMPMKVHVHPDASAAVIAKACKASLTLAAATADLSIILLDREQKSKKPGELASAIEIAIARICGPKVAVKVVLKDRAYENWLVADMKALEAQPKRFKVTKATLRQVQPDRADLIDAIVLLKNAADRNLLGPD